MILLMQLLVGKRIAIKFVYNWQQYNSIAAPSHELYFTIVYYGHLPIKHTNIR